MWEILIAVGLPLSGAAIWTVRYFWKKEQCFIALANKIKELTDHDKGSVVDHDGYEGRLTNIERNQDKWIIYLKLLLRHNKIPFDE